MFVCLLVVCVSPGSYLLFLLISSYAISACNAHNEGRLVRHRAAACYRQ